MTSWRFMLDTDTVSFLLRGEGNAGANLTAHAPSQVCISAITLSELRFGADKRASKRLHKLIDTFTASVEVASFDVEAAAAFGRICSGLASAGKPIGVLDTLIAAHALSLDLTLVTNNTKHFSRVRGLKTRNWLSTAPNGDD
ncbi:MAG TPA: PIN domain-containing protein [Polyangiaceae bacterium]